MHVAKDKIEIDTDPQPIPVVFIDPKEDNDD